MGNTNYPASIDTTQNLPTVADNFTPITASVVNPLRDAILAIERTLGVNPGGNFGTVVARLNNTDSVLNNLQVIRLAKDLGGTTTSPLVIGIQGNPVSSVTPAIGNVLAWNGLVWEPSPITSSGLITFARDLSGNSLMQTVIGIQTVPVSSTPPLTNQSLVYSGVHWVPSAVNLGAANAVTGVLPAGNQAGQNMSGDVTGTTSSSSVVKLFGATIPGSGSLTTGNILQVNGSASLTYAPLNLGGGSNYVTGVLPAGNQASQAISGDVTGSTAATTVIKINGATVPVSGGLTTGNVLQVSGATSLTYAPINLGGGSNYVTGVLSVGNLPFLGGDVTGPYNSTSVVKIFGNSVASGNPSDAQVLTWVGATNAWTPVNRQVSTIAQLRTTSPITATAVINLQGYYVISDGGSGLFSWNSSSTATDNGGTIIQVTGIATGRWIRQFSSTVNVKWFGAKGDGVTDDTNAINSAISAMVALVNTTASILTLYLPVGTYVVSSPTSNTACIEIPASMRVLGDEGTTLTTSQTDRHLVRFADAANIFDNIVFLGGKCALIANGLSRIINPGGNLGSVTIESNNIVTNCTFKYQHGPSIALDSTTQPGLGSNAQITIKDSFFQTSCACWAGWNGAIRFQDCYCFVSQNTSIDANAVPVLDDNGVILPFFVSYSIFFNEGMIGVPQFNDAFSPKSAFIGGSGNIISTSCRYGGETLGVLARVTTSLKWNGQTIASQIGAQSFPQLVWDDCSISCPANHNWLEIYNVFPMLIDVRIPTASVLPSSSDPRLLWLQSNGVWIDSVSCPTSTYLGTDQQNIVINFQGLPLAGVMSFRTGTNPATTAVSTDVTGQLKRFMIVDFKGSTYNLGSATNLFPANKFQLLNGDGISGSFTIPSTDTSTGRSINTIFTTASPPGTQLTVDFRDFLLNLPAGEYTMSYQLTATFGGRIDAFFVNYGTYLNPLQFATLDFSPGLWQRTECTFWHDGYNRSLQLLMNVPNDGYLTGPAYFTLHPGRKALPWTYPQLSNSSQLVLQELYGIAPPTTGTAIIGDKMWNTNPVAGSPAGWICVAAGTPGKWDPMASVVFGPSDVNGLNFDYNPVGLTAGAITTWADATGTYNLAGTATAASSGGPNNLPIVTFNGTSDFMTHSASSVVLAPEVFMVVKFNSSANGTVIDGGTGNDGRINRTASTTVAINGTATTGTSTALTTYAIWHAKWDGTNVTLIIQGASVIGPTADVATGIRNGVTLGNFGAGSGDAAPVSFARCLGYSSVLSSGDANKIITYLQTVYGVT